MLPLPTTNEQFALTFNNHNQMDLHKYLMSFHEMVPLRIRSSIINQYTVLLSVRNSYKVDNTVQHYSRSLINLDNKMDGTLHQCYKISGIVECPLIILEAIYPNNFGKPALFTDLYIKL